MKRASIVLEEKVYSDVLAVSKDIDRSFNYTVSLLLQAAVKERLRKRNGKQKNSLEHFSPDMGESNSK